MFTGIISDIGTVTLLEKQGDLRASIKTSYNLSTVAIGASIACSGVCLTVISKQNSEFVVEISAETISCSNIANWGVGSKINLERALMVGDELGGHIVSGHVDGIATLESLIVVEGSHVMDFKAPQNLAMFIAEKGSVTLDGVSLTVNKVVGENFSINIIPHTFANTTLGLLKVGDKVNLEIDTVARYISRMVNFSTKG